MKKEYADYSTSGVVIYTSPAIYNGQYVPCLKRKDHDANDFRTSLMNAIKSLDRSLQKSEKILPFKKIF